MRAEATVRRRSLPPRARARIRTARARVGLALAVAGAAACGGRAPAAAPGPAPAATARSQPDAGVPDAAPPVDYAEIELGSAQPVLPLLKVGAERLGCTLVAEEVSPPAVAYQCETGTLFVAQVGTRLRYTCQPLDAAACDALMDRVYRTVLDAAGAGGR